MTAIKSSAHRAASYKLRGFTTAELIITMIIIALLSLSGYSSAGKRIDMAKASNVRTDFSSIETSCYQMMFERDGLTRTEADTSPAEFASIFNKYIDSEYELDESGVMSKKDAWGAEYIVTYTKLGETESTVLVESVGKYGDIASHALLIHYKDSEVRVGTSGFENDKGADTSDADFTKESGATITTLWSL